MPHHANNTCIFRNFQQSLLHRDTVRHMKTRSLMRLLPLQCLLQFLPAYLWCSTMTNDSQSTFMQHITPLSLPLDFHISTQTSQKHSLQPHAQTDSLLLQHRRQHTFHFHFRNADTRHLAASLCYTSQLFPNFDTLETIQPHMLTHAFQQQQTTFVTTISVAIIVTATSVANAHHFPYGLRSLHDHKIWRHVRSQPVSPATSPNRRHCFCTGILQPQQTCLNDTFMICCIVFIITCLPQQFASPTVCPNRIQLLRVPHSPLAPVVLPFSAQSLGQSPTLHLSTAINFVTSFSQPLPQHRYHTHIECEYTK